jgi:Tfp pilus assembly protein FimT
MPGKNLKIRLIGGFTLAEVMVVIGIGVVLLSIVIFSLTSLRDTNSLQKNVIESIAFIEEARTLSISNKNDSVYGAQLQSDRIIMFVGTTSTQYKTYIFDSNTTNISDISLNGGGSVILFKKTTGGTDNFGSFKIKTNANSNSSTTIVITSTGVVGKQ